MIFGHFLKPKKKKQNERMIKNKLIRDIRTVFEEEKEKEDYYEPKSVSNFWNNNYIEYEDNSDKNKDLMNILIILNLT